MEISGTVRNMGSIVDNATGCFYQDSGSSNRDQNTGSGGRRLGFKASRNWTGSTSSNGDHSHTLTVTKNTSIYGNSSTVQPASLKVRVKTRAK